METRHDGIRLHLEARLIVLGVMILAFPGAYCVPAQEVEHGGKIRMICIGDIVSPKGYNSYMVIRYDPAIELSLVPSSPLFIGYDNAKRNMRTYMPRTYQRLIEDHDVSLISDADQRVFTPEWVGWLSASVVDGGMDLLWLGAILSVGVQVIDWRGTTLAEVLPVGQEESGVMLAETFYLRILDPEEPLMGALPWEDSPNLYDLPAQFPKQGASRWAVAVGARREEHPMITHWEPGEGSVLCFSPRAPHGVEPWFLGWSLYPQAMTYLAYRTAGRALPEDPYLFQSITRGFTEFAERNSLLSSVLDWVEKFDANPTGLRQRLQSLSDFSVQAEEAYIEGNYEEALTILNRAADEQASLREAAMRAKDEALLWVYAIEWCSTTGVLMVSGYLLWALMVRRRLYRQTGVSRLRPRTL